MRLRWNVTCLVSPVVQIEKADLDGIISALQNTCTLPSWQKLYSQEETNANTVNVYLHISGEENVANQHSIYGFHTLYRQKQFDFDPEGQCSTWITGQFFPPFFSISVPISSKECCLHQIVLIHEICIMCNSPCWIVMSRKNIRLIWLVNLSQCIDLISQFFFNVIHREPISLIRWCANSHNSNYTHGFHAIGDCDYFAVDSFC